MLLSYLKLAVRLLLRNPFFTFINVLGLSVEFAVFIILWQYSRHELISDRFHKDYDRIYRVVTKLDFTYDGKEWVFMYGYDMPIHTVRLAKKIPQVQSFTRIYNQDNFIATWIEDHSSQLFLTVKSESGDENQFIEKHVAYSDPNMFEFFGIALIRGNVLNVLNDANTVAISQQTAQKYFGMEDPLNKILLLNNSIPLKVTGVFAHLPKNTHLEFEIVISMALSNPCADQLRDYAADDFIVAGESRLHKSSGVITAWVKISHPKLAIKIVVTQIDFKTV